MSQAVRLQFRILKVKLNVSSMWEIYSKLFIPFCGKSLSFIFSIHKRRRDGTVLCFILCKAILLPWSKIAIFSNVLCCTLLLHFVKFCEIKPNVKTYFMQIIWKRNEYRNCRLLCVVHNEKIVLWRFTHMTVNPVKINTACQCDGIIAWRALTMA